MTAPTSAALPCVVCAEPLTFRRKRADEFQGPGQGDVSLAWRHPDGSIYKQREDQCGSCRGSGSRPVDGGGTPCGPCQGTGVVWRDDHCALPDRTGR